MPPKKKKTHLKKVERGYATISIPKKPSPAESPPEGSALTDAEQGFYADSRSNPVPRVQDEETASLQRLVDKYQEKTEKAILRVLKTVRYERRMAKGLPQVNIDENLVDEIISLVVQEETLQNEPKLSGSLGEKLMGQLGLVYGVLRCLGFSEEVVMRCLKEARGFEFAQIYDWLYVHCSTGSLEFEKSLDNIVTSAPETPQTSDFSSVPGTPKQSATKLLPLPSSSSNRSAIKRDTTEPHYQISPDLSRASTFTVDPTGSGETSDIDDPNAEYVRLQLRIRALTRCRGQHDETMDDTFLKRLHARLNDVKKHYFFSEKDAEQTYRVKQREADEALLFSRLREDNTANTSSVETKTEEPRIGKYIPPTHDVFDDSEDDNSASGGLFELLEPLPTTEMTSTGTIVTVRDMAFPKQWTGRTPKLLLQDFVTASDRYADVLYSDVSGGSRAKRASIHVNWTGGRANKWTMEDVACHDQLQAEHYVATVALHALTYPCPGGFGGSGNPKSAQLSYKHLPLSFRELWNELEAKRKEDEGRRNREIWKSLVSILNQRLSEPEKPKYKGAMEIAPKSELRWKGRVASKYDPEQLKATFLTRRSSRLYQEMLMQRNSLPISSYRQTIIEPLETSQVIVLCGETGCGKSTQLPSFILEDQLLKGKHCKIVVAEPRRISAISLAQRVSRELGEPPGAVGTMSSLVGYSIRLESQTSKNTRLNFVTNGIALRMFEERGNADGHCTAIDEITHIIVDEVHERGIDSDFLLIVLKALLHERRDLKVVLMSATLDAERIAKYFGGCPVIQVPGRTFPVDTRFLEDTLEYVNWSITESSPYAKRVNDKHNRNKMEWSEDLARNEDEDDTEQEDLRKPDFQNQRYSPSTVSTINLLDERQIPYELIIRILEKLCDDPSLSHLSSAFLIFMPGLGEIRRLNDILVEHAFFGSETFRIFPLHSMISSEKQSLAFDIPPPGVRKIVIATNIAETGITIPDITCVIDSGKHREMRFDEKRQISRLIETFIARSNAIQRRGRAGRVQPGICFHLYSRTRYDLMADHPLPEMLRLSLSDQALRIKVLKVNLGSSIEDVLARSLDPPSSINIQRAKAALVEVGALTSSEDITPLGRLLSKLPTDVHLGKFLLTAALFRCLDPALTIAAALSSKSPFVTPFGLENEANRAKNNFRIGNSDFLTIHNAFTSWRKASNNPSFARKFCGQHFLSHQNLQQIEELRQQLLGYLVDSSFIKVDKEYVKELNRTRYAGGRRTRFVPVPALYDKNNDDSMVLLNAALCAGLYPKLLALRDSADGQHLRTLGNNQSVAFHPSSVNFGKRPRDFGINYLSFFTIMQSKKLYAWETGPVDDIAIILLCGDCEFKLIADTVIIDRKVRYRLAPKTNVALKYLRANLASNLAARFKGKELTERQQEWNELAMRVLGTRKSESASANTNDLGIVIH